MLTTERFPLQPGPNDLTMPGDAEVLKVGLDRHAPCLWAMLDNAAPVGPRTFQAFATGEELPATPWLRHVGSFHFEGAQMLHVFELPVEAPTA